MALLSSVLYSVEWYSRLLSSLALCEMWLYKDALGMSGESSCSDSSVGFPVENAVKLVE